MASILYKVDPNSSYLDELNINNNKYLRFQIMKCHNIEQLAVVSIQNRFSIVLSVFRTY